MKTRLTNHRPGNTRLILIFAGWGSDHRLYDHIEVEGWDTMVVWDYTDPTLPDGLLDPYPTVYLYAWSMGVFAASSAIRRDKVTAAFAVNGTPTPRDDHEGIPETVYDGTRMTLQGSAGERSLMKFRLRMCGSKEMLNSIEGRLPQSDPLPLARELEEIAGREKAEESAAFRKRTSGTWEPLCWRRAYVSSEDRIFPAGSQRACWKRLGVEVTVMEGMPHYVDLARIVGSTIQDRHKIARRFADAYDTYDAHADPQRRIAGRLAARLAGRNPAKGGDILEIGSGTGLFTRLYTPLLRQSRATYVDLYPLRPYGLAPEEIYVEGDAEEFVADDPRCEIYDFILSASAIQWFVDLRRFFLNASRRLHPDGLLVCSTFGPGNLRELDALRAAPIIYPGVEELRDMLHPGFRDIRIESEEIVETFESARHLLLHLRNTGVGGGTNSRHSASALLKALTPTDGAPVRLTYRPLYITAVKR